MKNSPRKKASTIYDIAKKTGFTAATVSRTLNNKGYISDEARKTIFSAAEELNYTPNPAARSLKTKKTNQLMLSMPHARDFFYFDMIEAVQNVAKSQGYSLIVNYSEDDKDEELRMLNNVRENFVDGLILISLNFTENHLKEISKINYPIVLSSISNNWITGETNFDYVGADTQKGIYLSTRYLIGQGHTKIGYVGLPSKTQVWDERHRGFCIAMEEAGLDIDKNFVMTGGYKESFGYEAGLRFAGMQDRPTAICASTDLIVLGLYRAFKQEGLKVPDDVSIIGMDNIVINDMVEPKISSVSISQADIGRTAAEIIFKRLNGSSEPHFNIIFQPSLVIRDSVARFKAGEETGGL